MNDEQMQKHKEYQKNYQKMYRAKKKRELENSKKKQCDFDKNAVLTPPKNVIEPGIFCCTDCIQNLYDTIRLFV